MSRNILLKIAADVDPARRGLRGVKGDLKALAETKSEPLVRLREQGLEQKLSRLQERLAALSRQESTPRVKIAMGQVAGQIQRVERELAQMGVAGERAGRHASAGLVRAGHASDGLAHKLKEHRSEFIGFAKGAVGIAAAFSAITDAKSAVETTDEIAKATLILGRNFGFTAEEASKWAVVAQSRDVDPTALSTGFTRLSRAVEAARSGTKSYQDTFKQLGISNAELIRGQRDFPFLISKVTEAFSHMSGGTRRASIAQQIFGRGSRSLLLLLRQGSQGFEAQSKMAEKYGATLNEKTLGGVEKLVVAQRQAHYATTGLQIAFGTGLAPVLTRVTQRVSRFILGMRNGTGAGGRFARQLRTVWRDARPLIGALGSVVRVVSRIPHVLGAAIGAWATYRVTAALAARVTAARTAQAVGGIGKIAPAVVEAEAVTVTRFAAMRAAVGSMINPLAAVLAGFIAIQQMKSGGDVHSWLRGINKALDEAKRRADIANVDPRLAGFPDGGASTANGRPTATGGRRSRGNIQTNAQILAGLGSSKSVTTRNLRLEEARAQRAYVNAVRRHGADSAAAISAADALVGAKRALHDELHPPETATERAAAARRRRRRQRRERAAAANPDATPQDLANERAARSYEQAVRKYGVDSPQAKAAKDREGVAGVRAAIQAARDRLASDVRKFGSSSEKAVRDRIALSKLQVRLIQANNTLADALKKNTAAQHKALLPRLTDVAYHPVTGHMHHNPIVHGIGAAGHIHHHEGATVQVTTPGGIQYPDAESFAAGLQRKLAAKGNG